jgi:hypothetical protein
MNIKFLRLDNLLRDRLTGELLKVTRLCGSGVETFVLDRSKFPLPEGWQAERIPIHKSWFTKFGFKWITRRHVGRVFRYWELRGPGYTLRFKSLENGTRYQLVDYNQEVIITTVDELQNACIDLTRQELEYKP